MENREPYRAHVTAYFKCKAKDVRRKDTLNVGGVFMRVQSNKKNSFGQRIITATDFRTKSINTLILGKNLKVRVSKCKTSNNPSKDF